MKGQHLSKSLKVNQILKAVGTWLMPLEGKGKADLLHQELDPLHTRVWQCERLRFS